MHQNLLIAPSLLAADFSHLEDNIRRVTHAGAKILHLDIMDGNFVPNISFGPDIVKKIDSISNLPLDTHLMVQNPDRYLEVFQNAGSDILTVHVEACVHLHRTILQIKELGMKAGVALNPATPISLLTEILPVVDLVLIMSVNPGFGGQKFIASTIEKIHNMSKMISNAHRDIILEVDGGIDLSTITAVKEAGARYFVAGNAVFGKDEIEKNFQLLQSKL
ncbi:MAG: ribulose-phosphate 3-epimerase [Bacteroidota bacterium]